MSDSDNSSPGGESQKQSEDYEGAGIFAAHLLSEKKKSATAAAKKKARAPKKVVKLKSSDLVAKVIEESVVTNSRPPASSNPPKKKARRSNLESEDNELDPILVSSSKCLRDLDIEFGTQVVNVAEEEEEQNQQEPPPEYVDYDDNDDDGDGVLNATLAPHEDDQLVDPFSFMVPATILKASKESGSMSEVGKLFEDIQLGVESRMKTVCENLFSLICGVVAEKIYTRCGTISVKAQEALYRQEFKINMETMLINSYLCENLFERATYLFKVDDDGRRHWPKFFIEYVDERLSIPLTKTVAHRKRKSGYSDLEGFNYMFSELVKDTAKESRREINNRLSNLWRDPSKLASGETPSGLFDVIRATTRRRDAVLKSKAAVHSKSKYATKKSRVGDAYTEDFLKKFDYYSQLHDEEHFPHYWLTFVLFGPPAPEVEQLAIYNKNIATIQRKIIPIGDEKALNKYSRRKLAKEVSDLNLKRNGRPPKSVKTPANGYGSDSSVGSVAKQINVTHTIVTEAPKAPVVDFNAFVETKKEKRLNEIIDLYKSLGKNAHGEYTHQDLIQSYTYELIEYKLTAMRADELPKSTELPDHHLVESIGLDSEWMNEE